MTKDILTTIVPIKMPGHLPGYFEIKWYNYIEYLLGGFEMSHKMNLWNDSFIAIKEGWKTIEMRLNDDKRRKIQTGDIIEFTNTSTLEKMSCLVVKIYNYKTFEELYLNHSKVSIGYKEDENAKPEDMLVYYSMEEIKNYGVLGIEIKVL